MLIRWRNVGNHDGAAVAGQGVLEESGQLGVAVVDELALALGQRVDAVPEGEQGAVDVGALLQPLAAILHSGRVSDSDRTLVETKNGAPEFVRPSRTRRGRSCTICPF